MQNPMNVQEVLAQQTARFGVWNGTYCIGKGFN